VSDHPDHQFDDDKKISALYRAGSTAQPPEQIDHAIRAEARRSVSSTPRCIRFPWAVPVSIAAVLVLSVSLISLIHEEAPTVSNIRENCEQLSHSACLGSEQCSLMVNDQQALVCNDSINHCDTGFVQRVGTKESCETKQACVYLSDPCFCPPDVICACEGGQLPQCQPRKN